MEPLDPARSARVARLFKAVLCTVRRAMERETGQRASEADAFEEMIDHALVSWQVDNRWLRTSGQLIDVRRGPRAGSLSRMTVLPLLQRLSLEAPLYTRLEQSITPTAGALAPISSTRHARPPGYSSDDSSPSVGHKQCTRSREKGDEQQVSKS